MELRPYCTAVITSLAFSILRTDRTLPVGSRASSSLSVSSSSRAPARDFDLWIVDFLRGAVAKGEAELRRPVRAELVPTFELEMNGPP